MAKEKKISSDMYAFMRELIQESLRDWFKKEDWVRIDSAGNIAGPCGTSKNKKNPDRCLPRKKAQSLTKGERAATAAKKKKAGSKGKTVVKNTKKATVQKEGKSAEELKSHIEALSKARAQAASKGQTTLLNSYHKEISKAQKELKKITTQQEGLWANINAKKKAGRKPSHGNSNAHKQAEKAGKALGKESANPLDGKAAPYGSGYKKVTKEDIRNLVTGTIAEMQNENILSEKDDRCTRIAKRKYDTWPSAYASGAVVRCRRGEIWKDVKEETLNEMNCKHGKYYCNHDKKYKCRKGPKKSR